MCSCENRPVLMPQRGRLWATSVPSLSAPSHWASPQGPCSPGSWRGLTAQLNGCWVTTSILLQCNSCVCGPGAGLRQRARSKMTPKGQEEAG